MAGTVAIAHERDQLAVVMLQHGSQTPARSVRHANDRGPIVEALQPRVVIALGERSVRRAPVDARPQIPEQVKHHGAERIVPAVRGLDALVERHAQTLVAGAMVLQEGPGTGRKRNAVPVED